MLGDFLSGKRVIIRLDNTTVVTIINKQSFKCHEIMKLVRFFVLRCLRDNFLFKAVLIPGYQNNIADALSRLQMHRFKQWVPTAHTRELDVPAFLWVL